MIVILLGLILPALVFPGFVRNLLIVLLFAVAYVIASGVDAMHAVHP